jgi:hypothetical protein
MATTKLALPKAGRNSNAKTWQLTDEGLKAYAAGNIKGQQGVIVYALAQLGNKATTTEIVAKVDELRAEHKEVDAIMAGRENQGTSTVVAHYAGNSTTMRRKGYVTDVA